MQFFYNININCSGVLLLLFSSVVVVVVNGAPPPPRIFGNKNALRVTLSPQIEADIPEEELELENLKGHGNSNTNEMLQPLVSTSSPAASVANVKKPENEEKPALSDNANSLKFGHHNPGGIDETLFSKKSHMDGHGHGTNNNNNNDNNNDHKTGTVVEHDQTHGGSGSVGSGVWSELPVGLEKDLFGGRTMGSSNIKEDRDRLNFQLDYTPQDIAEYIFWTGDERGVAMAIGDFLQAGLVGREDSVRFLEDVKRELSSIRSRYSASVAQGQQSYNVHPGQASSKGMRLNDIRSSKRESYSSPEMTNTFPMLPYSSADAGGNGLNFGGSSSSGGGVIAGGGNNLLSVEELDYDEVAEKLRTLDAKMREYSLEEVIYQLAKDLFVESLKNSPGDSIQKFSAFIEAQAANGHIPKDLEKDVLEAMVGALVDAVDERGVQVHQQSQVQQQQQQPHQQQVSRITDGHVNPPQQSPTQSQPALLAELKKNGS